MRAFGSAKRRSLRRYDRTDELHRVVNREARRDAAARRVDVNRDFLLRIIRLKEQELRDDQRRHFVFDDASNEYDPFLEQTRIDVIGPLAPVGLLNHRGNEIIHVGIDGIPHCSTCPLACTDRFTTAVRFKNCDVFRDGAITNIGRHSSNKPLNLHAPTIAKQASASSARRISRSTVSTARSPRPP